MQSNIEAGGDAGGGRLIADAAALGEELVAELEGAIGAKGREACAGEDGADEGFEGARRRLDMACAMPVTPRVSLALCDSEHATKCPASTAETPL
jgi:hypothetical protein